MNGASIWEDEEVLAVGSGGGCTTLSALGVTELHAGHGARSEGSPGADPPQHLRPCCFLEER